MTGSRLAYLGTSELAVAVLRALTAAGSAPDIVITPPDRPRGRGRRLEPTPVAAAAAELGLDLHRAADVNAPDSRARIAAAGADLAVVCAFGQIVREPLLSELTMLNVHPSLLPRWRGAAPIERAIMAGDRETGVTIIRLEEGLDSGPIALSRSTPISPQESYGALAERLAATGGALAVEAVELARAGGLRFEPQPEEGVTYAAKVERSERRLDPARPAAELARTVRALTPHIGAHLELEEGERLLVTEAEAGARPAGAGEAGDLAVRDGDLFLVCGEGALRLDAVQPPGRKAMPTAEYLRGHQAPRRAALAAG